MAEGAEAKPGLRPEVSVAESAGFDARTLRRIIRLAQAPRAETREGLG